MKSSSPPVDAPVTSMSGSTAARPKRPRGFAAMDPKKVQEIARKGGRAAHEAGTAHRFNADEAREAGRKGGLAPHKRRAEDGTGEAAEATTPDTSST